MVLVPVYGTEPAQPVQTDGTTDLLRMRRSVGDAMRRDDRSWRAAVRARDPVTVLLARDRGKNIVSRAYYKLLEIRSCLLRDVSSPRRILSCCEAPGGFAQCAKMCWPRAQLFVTSLEGKDSIRFSDGIKDSVVQNVPSLADINLQTVRDALCREICQHSICLVTADGGMAHDDLDKAEQASTVLMLSQAALALRVQREGGAFVLKVFEGSTRPVLDLFTVLCGLYVEVLLYKPRTSKCSNSERYVVCRNLKSAAAAAAVAAELEGVVQHVLETKLFVQTLLHSCPERVRRAFDAMARKQAVEIDDVLFKRFMSLREMRQSDVDWLLSHLIA